jgi:hypothetical protein
MPSLSELLRRIDELDDDATLFAARPWSAGSDAACAVEDHESKEEVVETWGAWHGGRTPSTTEAVRSVIYYAEHDTYPPA